MPMRRRMRSVLTYLPLAAGIALAAAVARSEDTNLRPKTGGTENDPLIQLALGGLDGEGRAEVLLACLNQLPWASRTAVLPRYPGTIAKGRWQPKATAAV